MSVPRTPGRNVPTISAPRSPGMRENSTSGRTGAQVLTDGISRQELHTACQRFDIPGALINKALALYDNHKGPFTYAEFVRDIGPIIVPNVGEATSFHADSDFGPRWDTITSNFIEDAKHRVPLGQTRGRPPPGQPQLALESPWIRKMDHSTAWITDMMGHVPKGGSPRTHGPTWKPETTSVRSMLAQGSPRPETGGALESRCPTFARYNLTMATSSRSPARKKPSSAPSSEYTPRTHFEGQRARTVPKEHPSRVSLFEAPCVEKGAAWFASTDVPVPTPVRWAGFNTEKPGMYLYETSDSHEHFTMHCARETPSFKHHLARDRHMQKPLKTKVEEHLKGF